MGFDIIGDIHGEAGKLRGLLEHLGYRERSGAYRHPDPDRSAIFVGDFIDRGPRQVDVVTTVRRMVDAGTALAIMGNHEFNAIAWQTPDPDIEGEFLRPHRGELGSKNRSQHSAFLAEVENKPVLHAELSDWFMTLPLWLDLPGLRVVHACWHEAFMTELQPQLEPGFRLNRELMVRASREGTMEFRNVEALTKGLEVTLPEGRMFHDKDGHVRHNVRIRWWDPIGTTYRDLALMPNDVRQGLPSERVPADMRAPYDGVKPVFFGHYWMAGEPAVQTATCACVDYSAAKSGPLVAYRWDGEPLLDGANFTYAD